MPLIEFMSPEGTLLATVQATPGQSVMQAALAADVRGIEAECGGSMTCATCHVYLLDSGAGLVAPASGEEQAMLEFVAAERRSTSRLSCQLVPSGPDGRLRVQLPDRQV